MQTRRSLHQYEKATIALLSLESPEDYLTGLLQAERGLRMPSIAQKPNPILAVDRNGYRIRVYSGNQLNHDEKRITGAYRLGQYGDKRVDHDKNRGDRPQVPFFDSEAIFRHKLTTEPLSIFTGSEQEYHVFITEPDGRIVGYVCTEAPLSLDDDSVLFGTPRPPQLLYGLEKVFGASVLTDLANGELDSVPINKAIDIVRLAPRSNTDPEGDSLRNRDKVIIAFELGNALRALVSRFQDAGRTIAICDTELAKLEQIFYGLLGIRPAVSNNLPATTDTLPEPYNMLLRPRYDYERTGREVSVVAFELNILSSPESVERWLAVEELLWKYADAHSDEEKSRILGEIYLYAATHIIDAKLGKSEVNES
ncbi:hypothetical protein KC640_02185, partial [Candidatus Dojkabacteria bacterium]|nr:hypothetical protein [Candidatus Dojkabacteria bacterium]